MKLFLTLLLTVSLSGCGLVPKLTSAKPPFPEPVKELTEPCPDLKQIEGNNIAITDLLKSVVENYTMYYKCSLKNEGWNQWYKEKKEIYDKVKQEQK